MVSVTVIGGGVAGCTVGYLLEREGYEVTVVEKNKIGGLLREIEFDTGYHCDSAPHLLFYDPDEEAIVGELFERFTDLEEHSFYAKTYPTNDLSQPHDYPVTNDNIALWDDAEEIRRELADAEGKTDADYFEPYMRRQVGERLYQRYYLNYTEKHWGIDPARITGDWFDFKISFPEAEDSFFDGIAQYPDRKYTAILNDMISDCDMVNEGATGIVADGNSITGIETESGDILGGDLFVSTIDPSFLVDHDEDLEYRSMVILGVHIEASERLFPDHVSWGYFPNDHEFTRITDYDFTPQEIPEGEYILTVEFPCFVGDELWDRSPEWYEEYLRTFLEAQGIDATVLESKVRRAARAYPLPVESEIETFEEMNAQLSEYENMYNLGRVSTYEYIWIKDIVQQADQTVEEILAAESLGR